MPVARRANGEALAGGHEWASATCVGHLRRPCSSTRRQVASCASCDVTRHFGGARLTLGSNEVASSHVVRLVPRGLRSPTSSRRVLVVVGFHLEEIAELATSWIGKDEPGELWSCWSRGCRACMWRGREARTRVELYACSARHTAPRSATSRARLAGRWRRESGRLKPARWRSIPPRTFRKGVRVSACSLHR